MTVGRSATLIVNESCQVDPVGSASVPRVPVMSDRVILSVPVGEPTFLQLFKTYSPTFLVEKGILQAVATFVIAPE